MAGREQLQEVVRVCRVQSSSVAADSGGSTYRMREMCRCSNGCTTMTGETSEWMDIELWLADAELEQLQLHYVNCTLQEKNESTSSGYGAGVLGRSAPGVDV